MKKINFIPTEFLDFKKVAELFKIPFSSMVEKGIVVVEARSDDLDIIGY